MWKAIALSGGIFLFLCSNVAMPTEAPMQAVPKEPSTRPSPSTRIKTKGVQEALKAKGYDPGPIDGLMGPKTMSAVKAFQEASGLKGTGNVDKDTAGKLGVAQAGPIRHPPPPPRPSPNGGGTGKPPPKPPKK